MTEPRRVTLIPGEHPEPFDDYRLLGLVGQGQFAQVYCAVHKRTGELVAIKKTRHQPEQVSQEPFVLNELCHPNIVCAQAIFLGKGSANAQTPTGHQFVLDYCEAGTLRSHLKNTSTPLPLENIIEDILQGLSYIHRQRVIHSDLKPENILLTYQTQATEEATSRLTAKIGDFGSARLIDMPNQSRREIGSPTYAAPERFDGQSSQASDLYSAGVILYELLLGDRPFSGEADQLRQAHQTQAIPFDKNVTPALQAFLEKALHKQVNLRFGSADEMLEAFQALSYSANSVAPTTPPSSDLRLDKSTVSSLQPLNEQISEPVSYLLSAPQGCFIVTERAIYLLDSQMKLNAVTWFDRPCWVSVSPKGNWLIALPQVSKQLTQQTGQFVSLRGIEAIASRTVTFGGQSPKTLQAEVVQMLALDRRYLMRVSTSPHQAKSYLEFFTRKGQIVGDLPLDLSLSCAALTSNPYEIVALSPATASAKTQIVLISLRPFQVQSVALPKDCLSNPDGLGVFSWGFAVIDQKGCLFLDRSAHPVGRLMLSRICAIAPLKNNKLLIARATKSASSKDTPPEANAFSGASLLTVDLNALNLDLIL